MGATAGAKDVTAPSAPDRTQRIDSHGRWKGTGGVRRSGHSWRNRENGAEDALRRTRLANERTYLAWWRTGLATIAVSRGAGKLVPELSTGAVWPFELVGIAFDVEKAAMSTS